MMYFNLSTENKESVIIIIIIIIAIIAIIIIIVISFQKKQSFINFIPNICSKKFRNIRRKTPVLESL